MACLAGMPAAAVLAYSTRNLSDTGGADDIISPAVAGQQLPGLACGGSSSLGPAVADTGAAAAGAAPFMAVAFDMAVSAAAPAGARALQAPGGAPLGLAGVLGGGPMPASLSQLQRTVLQAIVTLSAGIQLPAPNSAGVTPDSAFGGQMRPWLAQLGAPAVDAWAVQLLLNGVAYYNLNGTNMLALRAALAAVPSAPATAAAASGGVGSITIAAIAGGAGVVAGIALAAAAFLLLLRRRRANTIAAIGSAPLPQPVDGMKRGAASLSSNPLHAQSTGGSARRPHDAQTGATGASNRKLASTRSLTFMAAADEGSGDGAAAVASQAAAHIRSPLGAALHQRASMSPQMASAAAFDLAAGSARDSFVDTGGSAIYAARAKVIVLQASSRVGYDSKGARETTYGRDDAAGDSSLATNGSMLQLDFT